MFKRIFGTGESVSFGKLSFAGALIACALFLVVSYINRFGVLFGGNILRMLDQLGLVRKERSYLAELKPSTVFALNDANAVLWFTWLAFIFAGLGVVLALYADYKRESTLYASAGFMVATLGIGLLHPLLMVAVQATGAVSLIAIRGTRGWTSRQVVLDESAKLRTPSTLDEPSHKR
ncbi:hypothetical protein [Polaromonas sp. YR568]|uniref:hypothetical protein n=1 Tax=Polaromonas sp. YR568 TaxID=1855301 RepID=UPI00398BE92D